MASQSAARASQRREEEQARELAGYQARPRLKAAEERVAEAEAEVRIATAQLQLQQTALLVALQKLADYREILEYERGAAMARQRPLRRMALTQVQDLAG